MGFRGTTRLGSTLLASAARPPAVSLHATRPTCRTLAETVAVSVRDPGLAPYLSVRQDPVLWQLLPTSVQGRRPLHRIVLPVPAAPSGTASHRLSQGDQPSQVDRPSQVGRLSQAAGVVVGCRWTSCRRRGAPRRWPGPGSALRRPLRRRALPPAPWCPSRPALVRRYPPQTLIPAWRGPPWCAAPLPKHKPLPVASCLARPTLVRRSPP